MNIKDNNKSDNLKGKTALITGGTGILGGEIAIALGLKGINIAICDIKIELSQELKTRLKDIKAKVEVYKCDVLNQNNVKEAVKNAIKDFGKIDYLINAAGGNSPKATTSKEMSFFNIPTEAFTKVMGLNLLGTVIPSQIVGEYFAGRDKGVILNISSMNAFRPLTRIPAYSAAKAAVSNFTQWLAVHMAQEYSTNIRVNAIAPGFFLTQQNRFLLVDKETNKLTKRGNQIIEHTPLGRFGNPEDLIGAVMWLLSSQSNFVTGIVLPIDGGFSAYSGV